MLRRRPWLIVVLGLFGIVGVLVAAGAAYWQYANFVPDYPRPAVAMPVPNAYDDYVRAGSMCEAAGGSSVAPAPPNSVPQEGFLPAIQNGAPRQGYEPDVPLAEVRALVARNRAALARLRQGFSKVYRNPPVVSNTQTFPELAPFRELARVLVTEGRLAEREGRMSDAARSYLDCLRLGVDVPRGGILLHGLVGLAVQAIGVRALEDAVDQLDGPTALAAAREMLRLDQRAPGLADALQCEKDSETLCITEMVRQGQGWRQFSGLEGLPGIVAGLKIGVTPKKRMLDDYRAYMDAAIADARKPFYAASTLPPPPRDPLNALVLVDPGPFKWRWIQGNVYQRIVEMRLAVRAYQLRHGAPPPTAEALVPEYLPAVPRDPFADKPLVYRVQGKHALIYSRGPDGDDDGGLDLGAKAQPGMNGDIVSLGGRRVR